MRIPTTSEELKDQKTETSKKDSTVLTQAEEKLLEINSFKLNEQDDKKKARSQFVIGTVNDMRTERDQTFKWFGVGENGNNQTLISYINESEKRINGISIKADYKDDWQANVFDPITRDKFTAVLARLAAQRMKTKFLDDEGLNTDFARVISNLYDRAGRGKNGKGKDIVFNYLSMFEAASKGTVIREEMYKDGKREIKDKALFNKNGKIKYNTVYEWEDVYSEIVPLIEFIPGDIGKLNIQEMGKCAREQYPAFETFKVAFSDYEDVDLVRPIADMSIEQKTYFSVPEKMDGSNVQVISYYNRITDSYDVVANGILLTPLGNPLPYKHNQLPFTVGRFDILSNTFFYGMSLAHKLSTFQDITNSIWNMMLDELFIALKTPIFNATGEDIDINWLYPDNVIDLKKGSDLSQIREFKTASNTGVATNAISIIKQRMDESSASGSEASGVAGAGRAKTAEEVATARQASMEIAGQFLRFMEWAEEDRAEQRVEIMLEKYPEVLKETGEYRSWVIDDVRLLGEELGKMKVRVSDKPKTTDELNAENLKTEDMSQVIEIPPEMFRDFRKMVIIVPDSSLKDTELRRLEKEIAWYDRTFQNPGFNQQQNNRDLAVAFGKDVNKVINQEDPEQDILGELEGLGKPQGIKNAIGNRKEAQPTGL